MGTAGAKNSGSKKFLIIVARFNDMITRCLLSGAEDTFKDAGLSSNVEVVWVLDVLRFQLSQQKLLAQESMRRLSLWVQ